MTNITSVTVSFENGIKREEYGPTKKAGASITASVAENEDGEAVLARIGELALAQVAALLDAPKPDTISSKSIQAANQQQPEIEQSVSQSGEAPPRRGRGRPRKEIAEAAAEPQVDNQPQDGQVVDPDTGPEAEQVADEWAAAGDVIEVTDQELLNSLSKRASELGAREPCVKLIASFATRTEGPPFKVQEIPQAQRKDFLNKLAALKA